MAYGVMKVCEALQRIQEGKILLPAIQRKFVWEWRQVEALFDSLMQGYPINTFMFWDVKTPQIKTEFKFYRVLNRYVEDFYTTNPDVETPAIYPNFDAVIDGQQRLTSLYIALMGSYAYRLKGKSKPKQHDEKVYPTRKLYLDLLNVATKNDETGIQKKYFLRFMREAEAAAANAKMDEEGCRLHHWYCVGDIMKAPIDIEGGGKDEVIAQIKTWCSSIAQSLGIVSENQYSVAQCECAVQHLERLAQVIFLDDVIHFYREEKQDMDHILDLFIRTNSGGTKLEFADLLMSLAIRHWEGDARVDIDTLIGKARECGFYVTKDWVLKACLYLTGARVKFKVESFTSDVVKMICEQWEDIRSCIEKTLLLLQDFGYKDESVRAKNAILPIAYFLYKNKGPTGTALHEKIRDHVKLEQMRKSIIKFMNVIILKHAFSAQSDNVLEEMRSVMDDHLNEAVFPLGAVIKRYEGTNRDLRFDDAAIERVLALRKGNPDCRALLMLLRPELSDNRSYDIDHLHPQDSFKEKYLKGYDFLEGNPELTAFYADSGHWDTVPNLHLLGFSTNRNKNKTALIEWFNNPETTENAKAFVLVPDTCSLELSNFKTFYETRKEILRAMIKKAVEYVESPLAVEEIVENDDVNDGRERYSDVQKEMCLASSQPVTGKRDTTKYNFYGQKGLKQQEIVEAVIARYIKEHPQVTFTELEEIFPRHLRGSFGCFLATSDEKFRKTERKRFRPNFYTLSDGTEIAISSQWGRAWGNGNLPQFLERARDLGYVFEELTPSKVEDVLTEVTDVPISNVQEDASEVVSQPTTGKRDTTKYNFYGQDGLKHQEIVEAVIARYIKEHPQVTFAELEEVFPRHLQGSQGCVVATDSEQFRKAERKRFRPNFYTLSDGTEIAISSQWGRAWGNGNLPQFLARARELGYVFEEVPPASMGGVE